MSDKMTKVTKYVVLHNTSMLFASVAQLVEQRTENPRVVGSTPTGGTTYPADVAHLVERHLAKVEVESSSLVARSSPEGQKAQILCGYSKKSELDTSTCAIAR